MLLPSKTSHPALPAAGSHPPTVHAFTRRPLPPPPSNARPHTHPRRSSLEVASLLITLYALVVGPLHAWRHAVAFLLAVVTPILVTLTNE